MRNPPKEFTVYWTSRFDGRGGYSTEQYKANMKTFGTFDAAKACHEKLIELQKIGGKYGQRIVHHVGEFTK